MVYQVMQYVSLPCCTMQPKFFNSRVMYVSHQPICWSDFSNSGQKYVDTILQEGVTHLTELS